MPGPSRDPAPFVVGAPRSGTTMLRLMLDSHPELAIPPETNFAVAARDAWAGARGAGADPVAAAVAAVASHHRFAASGVGADALRARVAAAGAESAGDVLRCFYELYAAGEGKPRWGDKTPHYAKRIRMLQRLLPEARFIHLIRDGRAWARSVVGLWIGPDTVAGCARAWVELIDKARRQAARIPAGHYLEVRYEDLVREPEASLRRLAGFVGLEFDPAMLRYHERAARRPRDRAEPERSHRGRPVDPEVRRRLGENLVRPPDPALIDRWRSELAPADVAAFEAIAGKRLCELGYPVG